MIVGIAVSLILVALHTEWVLLVLATAFWLSGPLAFLVGAVRRRPAPALRGRARAKRPDRGTAGRRFDRPYVGVGAVVIHEGRVLLIRRGKEPLRGRWVVPGGTVELGETLEAAIVREVRGGNGADRDPARGGHRLRSHRARRGPRALPLRHRRLPLRLRLRLAPGGLGRGGRRPRGARRTCRATTSRPRPWRWCLTASGEGPRILKLDTRSPYGSAGRGGINEALDRVSRPGPPRGRHRRRRLAVVATSRNPRLPKPIDSPIVRPKSEAMRRRRGSSIRRST